MKEQSDIEKKWADDKRERKRNYKMIANQKKPNKGGLNEFGGTCLFIYHTSLLKNEKDVSNSLLDENV